MEQPPEAQLEFNHVHASLARLGTNAMMGSRAELEDTIQRARALVADCVSQTPGVCGGAPCIKDTRIPVAALAQYAAQGATVADLADYYPHVPIASLRLALLYAVLFPERLKPL